MKNVNEVVEELASIYQGLKSGVITPQVATEMNNACGKIVKAKTSQLVYYQDREEPPAIEFWDEPGSKRKAK